MGKLDYMDIQLESPVYYSGDTVKGNVLMEFKEPMKMRRISKVHFTRTKYSRVKTVQHFRSEEKYVEQSVLFFGSDSNDSQYHPEGTHNYPFDFRLPRSIPSSFKGPFGFVRYVIKVVVDRPWKFNQERTKAFTVLKALDLNVEPSDMSQPLEEERGMAIQGRCCGIAKGEISGRLRTNRSGYVPGETIEVSAEVYNQSRLPITKTRVVLKRYVEYLGRCDFLMDEPKPSREYDSKVIAKDERGGVPPGGEDYFQGICLDIPPTPPSRLDQCQAINISYFVELYIFPKKSDKISLSAEVTIGTMPLRSTYEAEFQEAYPNDGEPDDASHPVINIRPAPGQGEPHLPPPYTDMLPPAYGSSKVRPKEAPPAYEEYEEECLFAYGDDEEVNVYGDEDAEREPIEWAPVYPTFRGFKGILGAVRAKKAFGMNLARSRAAAAAAAEEPSQPNQNDGNHQYSEYQQAYQNNQYDDNHYNDQNGEIHYNYNEQYYDENQQQR